MPRDVAATLTITLAEAAKGTKSACVLPTGKEVEVKVPAGIADGQQIRLRGQGFAGRGGRGGDLLIAMTIAPHPLFPREGADLRLELPITLYEAVLGGKVRVPTLDRRRRACASRRAPAPAVRFGSKAKAFPPRMAPVTCLRPCASYCRTGPILISRN